MFKYPSLFSIVCIVISAGGSLWAWQNLPLLETYPVHWGPDGSPDRYGSRKEVLFILSLMPAVSVFSTLVFYAVPKMEPLAENLQKSRRAFIIMWVATLAFLTAVNFTITNGYSNLSSGNHGLSSLKYIAFGMSLLFIILGNIMGKIRQNFLFGIRTPWTLSSDLAWEKTHRQAGKLFVISGLVGIVMALTLPAHISIITVAILSLVITVFCFIYSFRIWKTDPNRRT